MIVSAEKPLMFMPHDLAVLVVAHRQDSLALCKAVETFNKERARLTTELFGQDTVPVSDYMRGQSDE